MKMQKQYYMKKNFRILSIPFYTMFTIFDTCIKNTINILNFILKKYSLYSNISVILGYFTWMKKS